jgi:DNA-binding NarL/FixJ family response regulator
METQGINLFIVDDNKLMVADLKYYLQNRFGVSVRISTFSDGESCLEKIDKDTHIVILDYFLDGKNGLEILKLIKEVNPKTEVIMLSSNEDIVLAIESFRNGATDYVVKGQGSWKKITKLVNYIITEPIRILVREFGVTKFTAIFLLTFVSMGIVVYMVLQSIA